jgi:hypothetical protein
MVGVDHWTVSFPYAGIFPTKFQSAIAEEKSFSNGKGSEYSGDVGDIEFLGLVGKGSIFCILCIT